jgi:hypothetical protein
MISNRISNRSSFILTRNGEIGNNGLESFDDVEVTIGVVLVCVVVDRRSVVERRFELELERMAPGLPKDMVLIEGSASTISSPNSIKLA